MNIFNNKILLEVASTSCSHCSPSSFEDHQEHCESTFHDANYVTRAPSKYRSMRTDKKTNKFNGKRLGKREAYENTCPLFPTPVMLILVRNLEKRKNMYKMFIYTHWAN